MTRREHYAVPAYTLEPEYQQLGERRLLCLLCARVVNTKGWSVHERGIEHKSAKQELQQRK